MLSEVLHSNCTATNFAETRDMITFKARDGVIGKLRNLLLGNVQRKARYLVVDTLGDRPKCADLKSTFLQSYIYHKRRGGETTASSEHDVSDSGEVIPAIYTWTWSNHA